MSRDLFKNAKDIIELKLINDYVALDDTKGDTNLQLINDRFQNKERVLGIVQSGSVRVYSFAGFGDKVTVINDKLNGRDVVVAGNSEDNFMVSYINDPGDGSTLSFSAVQGQYPVVMTDSEGNMWDVNGRAVAGPRKDARLSPASSFMGYWFSFAAFYPDLTIYGDS